jgi:hypothetical protein
MGTARNKVLAEKVDARPLLPVPGVLGLYVQRARSENARAPNMVIASSVFIFPARAAPTRDGAGAQVPYASRLADYMDGLDTSLANMAHFPGWVYRLYVDESVHAAHPAGRFVLARLEAAARSHPDALELLRVRYEREGYAPGTTFLPSCWRFLPLVDPGVDLFFCVDLDNPPGSLCTHLARRWMADPGPSLLFIYPDDIYLPVQCAAHYARDLGPLERSEPRCPLAQLWFGKRGGAVRIAPPSLLAAMLELAFDPGMKAYFRELDLPYLMTLGRAVLFSLCSKSKREGSPSAALRQLEAELRAVLRRRPGRRQLDTRLAALALFGRVAASYAGSDEARRLVQTASAQLLQKDGAMRQVVAEQGYGVDEYVLMLASAGKQLGRSGGSSPRGPDPIPPALEIRASTPEAGVVAHTHEQAHRNDRAPRFLAWLSALSTTALLAGEAPARAALHQQDDAPQRVVEYAARAALLLRILPACPSQAVMAEDYAERLVRLLGLRGRGKLAQAVRRGLADAEGDEAFYRAAVRQVLTIPDPRATDHWLRRGTGGRAWFDRKAWRFGASEPSGFQTIKDVALRGLMLSPPVLHLQKTSRDPSALAVPW